MNPNQVQTFAPTVVLPTVGNNGTGFTTPAGDEHGRTLVKSDISDDVPKARVFLGAGEAAGAPGNSVQAQTVSGVSAALPTAWLTGAASPWVTPTPLTIVMTINAVVKTYTAASADWASTAALLTALNTALGGSYATVNASGALVVNTGTLSLSVGAGTGNTLLGWPAGGLGAVTGRTAAEYMTDVSPTFQAKTAQPAAGFKGKYSPIGDGLPLACFRSLESVTGGAVTLRYASQMPTTNNPAGVTSVLTIPTSGTVYGEFAAIVSSTVPDVVGVF